MFSSTAGPFQQQGWSSSSTQTPFQRLKPVCVELLSLTGRTGSTQSQQVIACLRRLQTTLRALLSDNSTSKEPIASSSKLITTNAEAVLSPSLINYVFYPLSELISTASAGITSLPDSTAEAVLDVLALLCSRWWAAWVAESPESKNGWQLWCDLVILTSSVLGSPMSKEEGYARGKSKSSDETRLSALRVLSELLSPRFQARESKSGAAKAKQAEWEWDGVSELPLLDEEEARDTIAESASKSTLQGGSTTKEDATSIFPTPAHLNYAATEKVAKGAISFVLSSCFSIAESSQENTEVRTAAVGVARHALLLWIGGACLLPPASMEQNTVEVDFDIPSLHYIDLSPPPSSTSDADSNAAKVAAALRLRPLLPGLTSSLTRLAASRVKPKPDGVQQKPTPSGVAASAIELLADLLRATLSDEALDYVISNQAAFGPAPSVQTQVTSLEDFAEARIDDDAQDSASITAVETDEPTRGATASKDAQYTLSTLAQVQLALRSFVSLTQPSLPGTSLPSSVHASVQIAILRLSASLLSTSARSFDWLDQQLSSMARLNANSSTASDAPLSSIDMLLCWIVDLASSYNSVVVSARARGALSWVQRKARERVQASEVSTVLVQLSSGSVLWSVLMQALNALPAAVAAQNDGGASRLALRVSCVVELLQQHPLKGGVGGWKLSQDMQDTFVRLLRPLKVDRLEYVEEASLGSASWRLQPAFSGLEASTSTQISLMWFNMGRSLALSLVQQLKLDGVQADNETFSLITLLVERAARLRSVTLPTSSQAGVEGSESLTSLVVAADLMRGVSSALHNLEVGLLVPGQAGKRARKVAHRLGKKIAKLVMDVLDGDAEEAVRSRAGESSSPAAPQSAPDVADRDVSALDDNATDRTLVERVKGISLAPDNIASTPARHGPALDLAFVRAADLSKPPSSTSNALQLHQQASLTIDRSNALLFSLLGSSSKLLGQSFRPLLLRSAYPLISGLSIHSATSSSDVVRQASGSAIRDIAFSTAYGDVKNCLLDHADYILGAACQRLISGLDEELRAVASTADGGVLPLVSAQRAPFVLVEMIRVLGSEIVPMVEDAIDEILDALDRFHWHGQICDGLLAVLDGILECMALEQATKPTQRIAPGTEEGKRDELEVLKAWLDARKGEQPAFDSADKSEVEEKEEEREDKPTKSQQVAAQILSKATQFLTHPSPLLRTRVLGLLRHGIATLAPQARTAELLPIVNAVWPFVMTRLGPEYTNTRASKSTTLSPIVDLSPTALGAEARRRDAAWYARLEESFVERDANVWVAAARVVEVASREVGEWVGKRVVDYAWPRFGRLLDLMRWKFDPRMKYLHSNGGVAGTGAEGAVKNLISSTARNTPKPTAHTHTDQPYILPSSSSLPAQLTLTILSTLTTVVHHLNHHLPDQAAWHITTHPYLLGLLDSRQPPALLQAAHELYVQLGRRNPEATAWVLTSSFAQIVQEGAHEKPPCFMRMPATKVHAETLFCLLSEFER